MLSLHFESLELQHASRFMPTTGFSRITDTLRSPVYGSYVIGNGTSLVGTWMQRIAVGWLTWELTGSPFWLGIIAFADLFPAVIVGPIAGAIADRRDRLQLILAMQALSFIQASVLFALSVIGLLDIYLLAVLTLFLGTVVALNQPARLALIPSLVPPDKLNAAIGINSVIFNLARFIGPAVAGIIIANGHVSWVFALNAVSFAFFGFVMLRLRKTISVERPRSRAKNFVADVTDGIAYAARDPGISAFLLLLIIIGVGARPLVELLPGFSAAVFRGGPQTLALLTSVFGLGAICGGLWLAGRDSRGNLVTIVNVMALVLALALLVFVSSDSLWVALPATAILGLAMVTTGAGIQTLLQLAVEPDMRGRVLSLYGLIQRGGPATGALIMGWVAEFTGLRWPLAAGAAIVALAAVWLFARMRAKT